MKTTPLAAIGLATMLVLVIACSSLETELIGQWQGEGPKGTVYYEFNSDRSYTMRDDFGTRKGTWRLKGSTLLLKTTSLTLTKKYALKAGLPEADFPKSESDFEDAPETSAGIVVKGDELTVTIEGTTTTLTR